MDVNIRARLKRHLALPLAAVAIVLITVILVDVRGAKDQGTYAVEHLQGDSSVLNDVTISGDIVDGNHQTRYTWEGSEVNPETEVYPYVIRDWRYNYSSFYERIGSYFYSVENNVWGQKYAIRRQENNRGGKIINFESATASVPVRPIVYKENTVEYTNRLEYGIAAAGEDVFFTVMTTKGYMGTNGIYKLEFDSGYPTPDGGLESSPIMTFSLDVNEEEGSLGIEVLGLESVGDKLALILVKDGALVIEGYGKDGERLGEVKTAPFTLAGREGSGASANGVNHYESYEAYSNDERKMLSLSFRNNKSQRTIISIDFSKGVKLADVTAINMENDKLREDTNYAYGTRSISLIDGRLYYVGLFREVEDNAVHSDLLGRMRFLLSVYEQGELVYQGELHTDVNDDLYRIDRFNPRGFGYDPIEYRNIYNVRIE